MAGSANLDPAKPERLLAGPGTGVLVNGPEGRTTDLLSRLEHGDVEIELLQEPEIEGALVAMDYRTGDLLAYVAAPPGYYKKNKNQRVDYQYDHIGLGKRQPGSSWKPIVYASGIDSGACSNSPFCVAPAGRQSKP